MPESPTPNPWTLPGILTGVCLSTLLGGGAFVYSASKPQRADPPASFAPFTAGDKSFRCEAPGGWKQSTAGNNSEISTVTFQHKSARIFVASDLAGSLMADIARSPGAGMGEMPSGPGTEGLAQALTAAQKPPIEKLHEAGKEYTQDNLLVKGYDEYSEKPMQKINAPIGEGRLSEFTAKGSPMTGNMHGYRATFLSSERRIRVTTRCLEEDWPKMSAAYMRVINSISPGQ